MLTKADSLRSIQLFCGIEALSAHAGHCTAMGCRTERVEYSGPVIKGRHPDEIILAAKLAHHFGDQLGRTPPVNGGHQLPGGGDLDSASHPVEDAHQVRIT